MQGFFRFTFTYSGDEFISETCPIDWEGQVFGMERDQNLHGIFSQYDSSLRYYGEMLDFINTAYDIEGIDAEIVVKIEMLDDAKAWQEMYQGTLDLLSKRDFNLIDDATALSSYQSKFLYSEILLQPKNLSNLLFNRNDIPLSMRATKNIDGGALGNYGQFDDFDLALHSKVIVLASGVDMTSQGDNLVLPFRHGYPPPLIVVFFDKAINELKIAENTTTLEFNQVGETYQDLSPAFIIQEDDLIYDLHVRILGTVTQLGFALTTIDYKLRIYIASQNGGLSELLASCETTWANNNIGTIDVDLVFPNISLNKDEQVWVYWELEQSDNHGQLFYEPAFNFNFSQSLIQFKQSSTKPDSQGKAWLVYECLAKSLEIMTGQFDVLKSSFYGRLNSVPRLYPSNGNGSLLSLTNGHQIRGNVEGKALTFKFKELLSSLDSIDCIGMGIELENGIEKVVIENRKYFYQNEVLVNYKNVPKINVERAKNLYYNQVIIGFSKWENESFNSLDEFNTKTIRNNNFKAVQNKYQRLSKFLGSGYALEIVRREQFKENPTKGNKYDNSNFFIVIRDVNGKYKPEKNEDFGTVANLISPESSYNLRISPTRSFIKHSQWFNGSMLKKQLDNFDFAEGFGNYELITNLVNGNSSEQLTRNIHEGADFVANTLEAPIFTPDYAEFSVPFDMSFWLNLQEGVNRYKLIEFSDRDSNYYSGWIETLKLNISKMTFDYKVLLKASDFPIVPMVDIPPEPPVNVEVVTLPAFNPLCADANYDNSPRTDVLFNMSSFTGYGGIYVNYNILSGTIDFETFIDVNGVWVSVNVQTALTGNGTFVAPYNGELDFKIEMTKNNAPAGTLTICIVIA